MSGKEAMRAPDALVPKEPKRLGQKWKFLVVSCDADSLMWCFAEARPVGGQVMFGKSITRTQWEDSDGVLAKLALHCFIGLTSLSSLIFTLLRGAWQRTFPCILAGPVCSCWLEPIWQRPGSFW